MKAAFLVFAILLGIGCKKEFFLPLDLCLLCTSIIEVNGEDFDSKPINTFYKYKPPKDTFFIVEIQEKESLNDNFLDVILFWRIPSHFFNE